MTPLNLLHPRRWLLLGGLLVLAMAFVACTDDNGSSGDVNEDDLPTNPIEIRVGPDGIDPPQEQVTVPDTYQLIVKNESDQDCSFYLGPYVRDLGIVAGETGQTDVQLPPSSGDEEQIEMGCLGDNVRQGTLVVRNVVGS